MTSKSALPHLFISNKCTSSAKLLNYLRVPGVLTREIIVVNIDEIGRRGLPDLVRMVPALVAIDERVPLFKNDIIDYLCNNNQQQEHMASLPNTTNHVGDTSSSTSSWPIDNNNSSSFSPIEFADSNNEMQTSGQTIGGKSTKSVFEGIESRTKNTLDEEYERYMRERDNDPCIRGDLKRI